MSKTKTRPTPVARNDAREESKTPIWDAEFAARWEALQAAFAAADGQKG